MAKKLTGAECHARAAALESCADHLGFDWTDEPSERVQGDIVSDRLRAEAMKYLLLGDEAMTAAPVASRKDIP